VGTRNFKTYFATPYVNNETIPSISLQNLTSAFHHHNASRVFSPLDKEKQVFAKFGQ